MRRILLVSFLFLILMVSLAVATQPNNYPKPQGSISKPDLGQLLQSTFKGSYMFLTDQTYNLTTLSDAQRYVATDTKNPFNYEGHDCDNFAAELWGTWSRGDLSFVFGYAMSRTHAFNIFVDNNLVVYVVEPFNNSFTPYNQIDTSTNQTYVPLMITV